METLRMTSSLLHSHLLRVMDEVDLARAELARLESVERSHLREMLAARRAAQAQRILIEELIKKRNPAIHRLPVELLVRIFGFAMVCEWYKIRRQRRNLAGVSRIWRDVILTTPTLWCDIHLTIFPREDPESMLMSELKRSQGAPLDVTISTNMNYSIFSKLLPYLRQTTNRWRSLRIDYDFYHPRLHDIIRELSKLDFPSLVDISIGLQPNLEYKNLLLRAPALKHLKLEEFVATDDFSTASPLKTLELIFLDSDIPPPVPLRIPNVSLTTLSLIGRADGWVLEPNTIHFPILGELTLDISHPEKFLEAILAPNLQHLHFADNKCHWKTFSLPGSKFSNVHHLTIYATSISTHPLNGVAFCQGFPGTRHAELSVTDLGFFFEPVSFSRKLVGLRSPVDNWASLERLTISDFCDRMKGFEPLVQWLETRQELGLPKLHVELAGHPDLLDVDELTILLRRLQNHCILELDCPLSSIPALVTRSAGPPDLVLPAIDPALINDIFWAPTE